MIRKILTTFFIILALYFSCKSQNLSFKNILEIQKMSYKGANDYLIKNTGWQYHEDGLKKDFYDYNYFKWSFNYDQELDYAESWLVLCQKAGLENAVIYKTTSDKFNEIKNEVLNDKHWIQTESYKDQKDAEHIIYTWANYNIEFIVSNEYQVWLYNSIQIANQKKIKDKLELEAKKAEAILLIEKKKKDSIAFIESEKVRIQFEKERSTKRVQVQSKVYDIRDFEIFSKINADIDSAISKYLNDTPFGTRINTVYNLNIAIDSDRFIDILPINTDTSTVPQSLMGSIKKSCSGPYKLYPKVDGFAVNTKTTISIPVTYERGSTRLSKKESEISYQKGEPSEEMKNDISKTLTDQIKGTYYIDYIEKIIEKKRWCTILIIDYKK